MYRTEHGDFTGDTWEDFCRTCFKLKYEAEGYQDMPASPGDFGIEGFTRTGKVFQCYCPDVEYPPDKLYEEQRDKITRDLNKLVTYEKRLTPYLKSIKIKQWFFVTPEFRRKDLIKHCQEKAEEFRQKGLSILDVDFDVLVHDIGFFSAQVPIVLIYKQKKIDITPKVQATEEEITNWKGQQNSLVENAVRKHGLRFPDSTINVDHRVNILTESTIKDFINGNILIRTWQDNYPEDYEKFERLKSLVEEEVKKDCLFPAVDNNIRYKEIEVNLKVKIKETFPFLEEIMVSKLSNQVMSDWILRCPIDFE